MIRIYKNYKVLNTIRVDVKSPEGIGYIIETRYHEVEAIMDVDRFYTIVCKEVAENGSIIYHDLSKIVNTYDEMIMFSEDLEVHLKNGGDAFKFYDEWENGYH